MNELLRTRLFSLLSEPSQVANEDIHTACVCFVEQLRIVSQSEQNYSEIFRTLDITRIEIMALQTSYQYEQGKKCA